MPSGRFSYAGDNSIRFYPRHIESPDEFYVEPLSNEKTVTYAQLQSDLAQFYEEEKNRKPLFQDGGSAERKEGIYGVYYYRDYRTKNLQVERCEVVGWRESAATKRGRGIQRFEAQIRFIDVGPKRWVPAIYLWKLHQRLVFIVF